MPAWWKHPVMIIPWVIAYIALLGGSITDKQVEDVAKASKEQASHR